MHHEQYGLANSTDRVPALLAINHAVLAENEVLVRENPRRCFEVYSGMLLLV